MSTTRLTLLFIFCSIPNALTQYYPYPPYQYAPYPYAPPPMPMQPARPQFNMYPYPTFTRDVQKNPAPTADPFAHIPTEIIDVDENVIAPETAAFPTANVSPETVTERLPYIVESHTQHYSSNVNQSRSVHIFESKPIQTIIRRTFTSNGRDGKNVISINMVNGVEVTTESENAIIVEEEVPKVKSEEEEEEEEEEDNNNKADDSDPKPIDSWLFG